MSTLISNYSLYNVVFNHYCYVKLSFLHLILFADFPINARSEK